MEHIFSITIYQEEEEGNVSKNPKSMSIDRKFNLLSEVKPVSIRIIAGLEFEALNKALFGTRLKIFSLKKPYYINVIYNEKTYEFVATKASITDKLNPNNKYFIFKSKKTDFLIRPKALLVEKFIEKKIEKKTDVNYFSLINGNSFNEIKKVYSPIIYTGMKD